MVYSRTSGGTITARATRATDVYADLKRAIIEGELLPGEPLYEAVLGERLSVSRTPIREAIRRLENDGLVETTAFRGARVSHVLRKDIMDAFDTREWVEPPIFARAVATISDEQLGVLRRTFDSMPLNPETRSQALEAISADLAFHSYISRVVGNRFAMNLLEDVLAITRRAINMSPPRRFGQAREEHAAILEALESRDGRRAADLVRNHIANARTRFSGGFND